jgi:hypothetical protein
MISHSATNTNKSLEPPLPYPGATPDAERAQKPLLPEPPYEPYAKKPALSGPPYKPMPRSQGCLSLRMSLTRACSAGRRPGEESANYRRPLEGGQPARAGMA